MGHHANRLAELARIFSLRFREDRCIQIASSLTFTTLLALVPIVTVAVTVISAFPVFQSLAGQMQGFVLNNLLPESVATISGYAERFSINARRLTAVGIVILGVAALMLMLTIDTAFNNIWRVSNRRPLLQRVLVYWAVLTVGPLCIGASLSLTSYLVTLSLGLIDHPPGAGVAALKFAALLLTSFAFALLYYTVPNRRMLKRDALLGGVAAGVCFEAMKQGFGFYIAHFPTHQLVYGAFAAVPIFLLWIYLSWLIVIGGAVLVAMLPEWRERTAGSPPLPGSDFFDALQALKALWRSHQSGGVVPLSALHRQLKIGLDELERILGTLAGAGWVTRSGPEGWVLSRDAATIKVEDIYRLFVFRADARAPSRRGDPGLESQAAEISQRIAGVMQISIEQLFEGGQRDDAAAGAGTPARVPAV